MTRTKEQELQKLFDATVVYLDNQDDGLKAEVFFARKKFCTMCWPDAVIRIIKNAYRYYEMHKLMPAIGGNNEIKGKSPPQ